MRYLHKQGYYPLKIMKASKSGALDIVCCVEGLYLALEAKQEGKEAEPLQLYNINLVKKAKGFAAVVHNVIETKEVIKEVLTFQKIKKSNQ